LNKIEKTFLLIALLFVLNACSTKYDKYLSNGKDALHNKNYELAINELESALIEKPDSEEAKTLLKKAEDELEELQRIEAEQLEGAKRVEELKIYASTVTDIYFGFFEEFKKIDIEDHEKHKQLIDNYFLKFISQPPKELYDEHQMFKDFFIKRRESVDKLIESQEFANQQAFDISNALLKEAGELIDQSNELLDSFFLEVNSYLNEKNIRPGEINWPFY